MFQVLLFAANKKRELNESLQSCLCALCTIYQFLHKFPEKVGLKETEAEKKKQHQRIEINIKAKHHISRGNYECKHLHVAREERKNK